MRIKFWDVFKIIEYECEVWENISERKNKMTKDDYGKIKEIVKDLKKVQNKTEIRKEPTISDEYRNWLGEIYDIIDNCIFEIETL